MLSIGTEDARDAACARRERLRRLLSERGILYADARQPVIDRRGISAPWMFYSWNTSLTFEGSRLMSWCLLDQLQQFESTQLATFGMTAIPLLSTCLQLGEGKFTGICVRSEPKGNQRGRQIEGPGNPHQPVVVIDDSLSSGSAFLRAAEVLELAGYTVEGLVALVNFPGRGGRERAQALGYRVEVMFDIWDDLDMPRPTYTPGWRRAGDFREGGNELPDGLHPADVARRVAVQLLAEGTIPNPPKRLDGAYDASGGTWVSFRDRATDKRIARDGFWHFDKSDADLCRDLVLATAKTVTSGGLTSRQLESLKIGVTFFGQLERIRPGQVDFPTYGLVARSESWPVKVGGALPNTQVFTSEREQLDLALRNASIGMFEPYELYRHAVTKVTLPDDDWLPYGAPDGPEYAWVSDCTIGERLIRRARAVAFEQAPQDGAMEPLPPTLLPPDTMRGVAVSLYRDGLVGCGVSWRKTIDEALVAATRAAALDRRFSETGGSDPRSKIAVSILFDSEWAGFVTVDEIGKKLRLGRDSLYVKQDQKSAVFLESVGPHYNWDGKKVAEELLRKARIETGPSQWITYRTASWLETANGATTRSFGFSAPPAGETPDLLRSDLELMGNFIDANLLEDGLPCYAIAPMQGWRWETGSVARVVHGLSGLFSVGVYLGVPSWEARAKAGLKRCLESVRVADAIGGSVCELPGQRSGPMGDCALLAALTQAEPEIESAAIDTLRRSIIALFHNDGTIHPIGQPVRNARDNDYLPNAAIVALAKGKIDQHDVDFDRYLSHQVGRFANMPRWGNAGWLPLAAEAVFWHSRLPEHAEAAFRVADWCIDRQVETTGAFLTDMSPGGPTFQTAFVAEGICSAWALALARDDVERARRYAASWRLAMRFCRTLIIRPDDAICFPDAARSVGGVRGTANSSTVRIDYVSHLAIAMSRGLCLLEASDV